MPREIYEVVAQGARYWFLFLMALIVWRSWRWYRKDKRKARKRMKLLPDAGFVGEMVVIEGCEGLSPGDALPLPREGTLGTLRTNDLCIQGEGVAHRHLWFRYDEKKGLMVEPFGKNPLTVDKEDFVSRKYPLYMAHGSCLYVGGAALRLRLFMGFESVGYAQRPKDTFAEPPKMQPEPQAAPPMMDEQQMAAYHQMWMQQQWMMQQQAYQQGYEQAMQAYEQALEDGEEDLYEEDELPFDMAQIAQQEGMVDHRMFMRPEAAPAPAQPVAPSPAAQPEPEEVFAPEAEEAEEYGGWFPEDEDMTDAAAPPKSAYVGHDEAEAAKRHLWDKYLGGGTMR